ncbi:MAG TPA: cytochrome c oxidase subunit II [Pirellulales bacterium]|jgi:cytochrome c oxidase subunit 2|nr:cytochrome c oxidase subunit II [Pirellulales bacterium]
MTNDTFRLLPEQASTYAPQVDMLYFFLLGVATFFTVMIAVLIVFFSIKYRRGAKVDRTVQDEHAHAVEILWMVGPLVLGMIIFFWGAKLFFDVNRPPAGALEVEVVGKQWMWKFQHPEGRREINELHVPLGQPVRLHMISEDVIHSLFVPAFRVKQDVLPGRYSGTWFEATKTGEFHLFCAEYCGTNHSLMKGRVVVLEPSEYQAWLSGGKAGESPVEAGRRLFEEMRCSTCHRGGSTTGRCPPLEGVYGNPVKLDNGQTVVADDDYLRESILRPAAKVVAGFRPIMPTFEGQLGEEGLMHVIAYIKSLAKQERAPTEP